MYHFVKPRNNASFKKDEQATNNNDANPTSSLSCRMHDIVAQLVGQMTRDQEVWGSIPNTGHE